jgi:transposase
MAISLPDARQMSDEVLDAFRLRALAAIERGFTETDVADLLGVSRETVCRWWSAYISAGLTALPKARSGRPLGSGRSLTDEQATRIQALLDENSPEDLGIASPLWNRRAVRDLISNECGVRLAVRTVGQYLKRWGYTAKKPRRHARKQIPAEVQHWVEETYPKIEQRAEEQGAEIHWCDETGVAADEHPGYGYAREGQPATIEVPQPHIRMNVISTITNEGTARFMTYKGMLNAALFLVFLERLLRSTTGKIFLIADRLSAHDTPAVSEWFLEHADRIELYLLPRYAPERNPTEYLNNDLKGNVKAEGLPDSQGEMRSRIQSFMRRLFHLPEHIKSYFQHPCAKYAAAINL